MKGVRPWARRYARPYAWFMVATGLASLGFFAWAWLVHDRVMLLALFSAVLVLVSAWSLFAGAPRR